MSYRCDACRQHHESVDQGKHCAAVVLVMAHLGGVVVRSDLLNREQLAALATAAERAGAAERKAARIRDAGLTPRGRRVSRRQPSPARPLVATVRQQPAPARPPAVVDGPSIDSYRGRTA
jgi:hypothetical protein